ncbi:type I-D CRISPR-associated protein Cas7/Csc2 [Chrysosporum ovalisporum APH033B]|jgi:CRISPR-associated protein Csc2|uniref:type I-D CRISPR-associated protein Cas7/Csc2 n=1 Tax=Umezakia ovalisporum TaxID=75695 RepID=UPI0024754B7D|nr:type I-D CRISPR-associated protein Cas7/Csc2 [Umezakia ovalisporum]MDH6067577.1 type I-D CRISPR-associated protein Cas7/Csc2 [Umezakia ovalisporum APH033B]MDH6103243.1 type I-D CRISPR-associated protein Cas7/Csc2 [Umezakia ovalisporum ANA283AFssAo]
MTILTTLKPEFQTAFPRLASGKYIHFIMLRHSQSFPVFQTDGILNTARTQAGLKDENKKPINRLVMFKRKQTTPERLAGRELLRSLNLTTADYKDKDKGKYCEYNGEESCKKCPDCIIYGFAIGDSGSERSKVYSDSAFSLSAYEESHRSFTFNAPYEAGTMSEGGTTRSSINQLDHVIPEITFPSVETLRDATYEGFIYVLGNLLRTKRYGAQESRTGTMRNYLGGIVFSDGEIFSNLNFTQALYDALNGDVNPPVDVILQQVQTVTDNLLNNEPVRKTKAIFGVDLDNVISEVNAIYQDETKLGEIITTLYEQTKTYAESFGAFKKKGKKD